MLENISEEEYNEAQSKLPELRKRLFDVRYEMALTRDVDKLEDLGAKVKLIKKDIARTLVIINEYEMLNNGRKMN